ncbi:MAG: hypothetical protein ACTSRA_12520 [Promethearchaeota archaeon]
MSIENKAPDAAPLFLETFQFALPSKKGCSGAFLLGGRMRIFTIVKLGRFYALKFKGEIIILLEIKKEKITIHSLSDKVKFSRRINE